MSALQCAHINGFKTIFLTVNPFVLLLVLSSSTNWVHRTSDLLFTRGWVYFLYFSCISSNQIVREFVQQQKARIHVGLSSASVCGCNRTLILDGAQLSFKCPFPFRLRLVFPSYNGIPRSELAYISGMTMVEVLIFVCTAFLIAGQKLVFFLYEAVPVASSRLRACWHLCSLNFTAVLKSTASWECYMVPISIKVYFTSHHVIHDGVIDHLLIGKAPFCPYL